MKNYHSELEGELLQAPAEQSSKNLTIRKSQSNAFKSKVTKRYKEKLLDAGKLKHERYKVVMLSDSELEQSIDPNWDFSGIAINRYREFQIERGGKSFSYIRSLNSTMRQFDRFCAQEGAYTYPASPVVIGLWFEYLLNIKGNSVNTVKQHKAMLTFLFSKIFRLIDRQNPIFDTAQIDTIINSHRRDKMDSDTVTSMEVQAKPLRYKDLKKIIRATDFNEPRDFRDLIIISLSYCTMLRISEIRTLKLHQVRKKINQDGSVTFTIVRLRSKTTDKPTPRTVRNDFARLFNEYIEKYCSLLEDDSYIFSTISKRKGVKPKGKALSLKTAIAIYHRAHNKVYGDVKKHLNDHVGVRPYWTAHSARVGGAIDGSKLNMKEHELMDLGDWKSNTMLVRYLRGDKESSTIKLQDEKLFD